MRDKVSPKVRAKLPPEELERRAEQRRLRCLELTAIAHAEAARRGGTCEFEGCEVEFQPGAPPLGRNPLHWHHLRPRRNDSDRGREYRTISSMCGNAKTTDKELKAELAKCVLLCWPHHATAEAEKRGREDTKKRRLAKGIPPDELQKLLAAANVRRGNGLRWRLMMELMAKCGMRVSEVCDLRVKNLHPDDWKIDIHEGKTGDREIYLPVELEAWMGAWLARRAFEFPDSEWVFPTASGGRVTRGNVADMLDRMTARAGIPDTHPHALRHTFATEFIRKGGNVADLQDILGHTTPAMSLRYAKSNPERVRQLMRSPDFGH